MLALSRKAGEWLQIGDGIRIHITRTGVTVGLGIEAPPDVKILRGELVGTPPSTKAAEDPPPSEERSEESKAA